MTTIVIGSGLKSVLFNVFSDCNGLTSVYYHGTAEDWTKIGFNSGNTDLTNTTRYYYSESEPTLNADGNYWHYDENGDIVVW